MMKTQRPDMGAACKLYHTIAMQSRLCTIAECCARKVPVLYSVEASPACGALAAGPLL